MKRLCLLLLLLLCQASTGLGEEDKSLKLEDDVLDFESIKKVLTKDNLKSHAVKKVTTTKRKRQADLEAKKRLYNYPNRSDFWTFYSEYWLVKNAQRLKWDFRKPAYGIEDVFKNVLETLGYYEVKFRILLVDTPSITHFALPSDPGNFFVLLSVPFMRTMDLTKLEISLLMLEDYFRYQEGYFKDYVFNDAVKKRIGTHFYQQKFDSKMLTDLSNRYDYFIFKKGFSFDQQFRVTQKMSDILKNHLPLMKAYQDLLTKIDDLIKHNVLYKDYTNIYPSPEMQKKWLLPSKPVL